MTAHLTLAALILVLPFTDRPGLAGLTPLGVWVGLAVYLAIVALMLAGDDMMNGNVERLERERMEGENGK